MNAIYRSARPGRKLIRVDSNPNTQSREESPNRKASPADIEPMTRQVSFSSYHVLPPIKNYDSADSTDIEIKDNDFIKTRLIQNDELMNDKKIIAKEEVPTEEAIASGKMDKVDSHKLKDFHSTDQHLDSSCVLDEQLGPERRKLYRKGDIFRVTGTITRDASMKTTSEDGTIVGDFSDKTTLFRISSEPGENSIERIHLAFRIPNKSRIDRYFLPTDRIGDIIAFLQHVIFDNHETKYMLELFINDFPRRKLEQLTSTLSDANVKDRTVIDVLICDDVGIS